tara:strand:- start:99 stop:575 length:477 start_codon:yes stop_codon:yes gene_type:complete
MDKKQNKALRRRLKILLLKMNIPRLQEETLDLMWIRGNLISFNPQSPNLQEAMEITQRLLEECRRKAKVMTDEKIFNMDIEDAKREKFMLGVKEYRGGDEGAEFDGEPVVALYAELVDAMNYNDEALKTGFSMHAQFDEILRNLAKLIRLYKESQTDT